MYELIQISKINDFVFCPYSLYLHAIYENFDQHVYHGDRQTIGKVRHENIEDKQYSTSKHILQGISIYSEKYKLVGKIDLYDEKQKALIERKHKVKQIFDGYKYQLYAQYLCLTEQGYSVEKLFIHSLSDNRRFEIPLPSKEELQHFEQVINSMWHFDPKTNPEPISKLKCQNCIYSSLCEYAQC